MMQHMHDYVDKLRHPSLFPRVERSVRPWAVRSRGSLDRVLRPGFGEIGGPVSINLDLTVACNYKCDHCIDGPLLNTGSRLALQTLLSSLVVLRLTGLRSVILIGGGEPTTHPNFQEVVFAIKCLGLQCAIVSNGSHTSRIAEVSHWLTKGDWIRLSLDAGSDAMFQILHRPRRQISLEEICQGAGEIKRANPSVTLGFSFIVSWAGAEVRGTPIADNVGEISTAARLARLSGFDYITYKPLLNRSSTGAERIDIGGVEGQCNSESVPDRIRAQLTEAMRLATDRFRVVETLNLGELFADPGRRDLRQQPRRCRMTLFRQVLTPDGLYACPVYRGQPKGQIAEAGAYRSADTFLTTRQSILWLANSFDASVECREITCQYNETNWWLDSLATASGPEGMIDRSSTPDSFL